MKEETIKIAQAKNFTSEQLQKVNVLPFQRDIRYRKDIETSIKEWGVITGISLVYSTAITGRRELYVLDGNHRLKVFNYLEIGCPVTIIDDVDDIRSLVKLMGVINNTQNPWTVGNYVDIYCYLQYQDYKILNQIASNFNITVTVASALLAGSYSRGSAPGIKTGDFRVFSLVETEKTLELKKLLPTAITGRMIIDLHNVRLNNDKFDFDIFKKKITKEIKFLKENRYDSYSHIFNSWF